MPCSRHLVRALEDLYCLSPPYSEPCTDHCTRTVLLNRSGVWVGPLFSSSRCGRIRRGLDRGAQALCGPDITGGAKCWFVGVLGTDSVLCALRQALLVFCIETATSVVQEVGSYLVGVRQYTERVGVSPVCSQREKGDRRPWTTSLDTYGSFALETMMHWRQCQSALPTRFEETLHRLHIRSWMGSSRVSSADLSH